MPTPIDNSLPRWSAAREFRRQCRRGCGWGASYYYNKGPRYGMDKDAYYKKLADEAGVTVDELHRIIKASNAITETAWEPREDGHASDHQSSLPDDSVQEECSFDEPLEGDEDVEFVECYGGCCPICGEHTYYFNMRSAHWGYCDEHKLKWLLGENLFSGWKFESSGGPVGELHLPRVRGLQSRRTEGWLFQKEGRPSP